MAKRVGNAEKELKTAEEIGIFQKTLVNDTEEQFIKDSVDYISKLYVSVFAFSTLNIFISNGNN